MSGNDVWPFVRWPLVRVDFCPVTLTLRCSFVQVAFLSWNPEIHTQAYSWMDRTASRNCRVSDQAA